MTTRATRELLAEVLPLAQFIAAEAAMNRGAVVKIDHGCFVTITPSWRTKPIEGLLANAGFTLTESGGYWIWDFPESLSDEMLTFKAWQRGVVR